MLTIIIVTADFRDCDGHTLCILVEGNIKALTLWPDFRAIACIEVINTDPAAVRSVNPAQIIITAIGNRDSDTVLSKGGLRANNIRRDRIKRCCGGRTACAAI